MIVKKYLQTIANLAIETVINSWLFVINEGNCDHFVMILVLKKEKEKQTKVHSEQSIIKKVNEKRMYVIERTGSESWNRAKKCELRIKQEQKQVKK